MQKYFIKFGRGVELSLQENIEKIQWETADQHLQHTRYQPMYDRAFYRLIEEVSGHQKYNADTESLRKNFLKKIDQWLHSSKKNTIKGLENFPGRDAILGVTHLLDDLHITHHGSLVIFDKAYAYHTRMRPEMKVKNLETLTSGDVLVFEVPSGHYGGLHPETNKILDRCQELGIPVHIDSAWYGCLDNFEFDYSHPAIVSASFSLSKGLGLGSHRTGIRYSKKRWVGPVTIINDYNMSVASVLWIGLKFMEAFPIDYLQERYGEAYNVVCEKLNLKKTNAIHVAMKEKDNQYYPVGIRPLLRFLVDGINELK